MSTAGGEELEFGRWLEKRDEARSDKERMSFIMSNTSTKGVEVLEYSYAALCAHYGLDPFLPESDPPAMHLPVCVSKSCDSLCFSVEPHHD